MVLKGNFVDVVLGKSIGGDIFLNREGKFLGKSGWIWCEVDINYILGFRNLDWIFYLSDWLIYKIMDYY